MPRLSALNIAIFISFLFHFSGAIGILCTSKSEWFIHTSALNFLVSSVLIFVTHIKSESKDSKKSITHFIYFFCIVFCIGFLAELIGVNTACLFGNYEYSNVLGFSILHVPIIIGVLWFNTMYCCCIIMHNVNVWAKKKLISLGEKKMSVSKKLSFSFILDTAFLATTFDYLLEPVAIKFNYWQWRDGDIPFFNYASWFLVSAIIVIVFSKLQFNKENKFALHFFIMQSLFLLAMRIYL